MEWKFNPATGQMELMNTNTNIYGIDVTNSTNTAVPNIVTNNVTPTSNALDTGGLFGLSGNQWGTLTNVGGLAMKAMALPGQMDYFKTQTGLAEQQLKSNQQAMADRKTFNQNWANASNSLTGKL